MSGGRRIEEADKRTKEEGERLGGLRRIILAS